MAACLIDTSSWVEALRVDGDPVVRERVGSHLREGRACLAEIVTLELWNGARGEREKRELARLETTLPMLETGRAVWRMARDLARACRSNGLTVPATDILVYACAGYHRVDLEHADAHFDAIRRVAEQLE